MERQTELELIDRIQAHRLSGRSTDTAPSPWRRDVAAYASQQYLEAERRLLNSIPTVVGLSGLLPEPGVYATVTLGDAPVVLTRDAEGTVLAMLNVCRHRGAQVADGCGSAALLTCPYHGWTYRLDGALAGRRRPDFFDGVDHDGLVRLPALEQHGLIWASASVDTVIPEEPLHGAGVEVAQLGLEDHRLFTSTSFIRPINWKLVIDTFLESYHIPVLHEATIDPMIHGDYGLFDAYGPHGRMVFTRKSIDALDAQPRREWQLLPHSTLVWAMQPNAVLIYQQDHAQFYQARPGRHPGEAVIDVSVYVPRDSDRNDAYWQKNFDLLVEVTDTEDFVTCAGIQRGFASGAQTHLTFGRNEPALQHYERSLDEMVADA